MLGCHFFQILIFTFFFIFLMLTAGLTAAFNSLTDLLLVTMNWLVSLLLGAGLWLCLQSQVNAGESSVTLRLQ